MKFIYPILIIVLLVACKTKTNKQTVKTEPVNSRQTTSPSINTDAFFQAALDGNFTEVKHNIDDSLDPNTTDADGHTALMFSAFNGHLNIVNYLIEKKVDVNQGNVNDRTALMLASSGPFNETVIALLDAGADIDRIDNIEHFTALMFAASEGQMAVVKTLLDRGANKTLVDTDGDSAIDFAIQNGHLQVADFIKSY